MEVVNMFISGHFKMGLKWQGTAGSVIQVGFVRFSPGGLLLSQNANKKEKEVKGKKKVVFSSTDCEGGTPSERLRLSLWIFKNSFNLYPKVRKHHIHLPRIVPLWHGGIIQS